MSSLMAGREEPPHLTFQPRSGHPPPFLFVLQPEEGGVAILINEFGEARCLEGLFLGRPCEFGPWMRKPENYHRLDSGRPQCVYQSPSGVTRGIIVNEIMII